MAKHILLLDNYDSFSWNLYQYLCLVERDAKVTVVRSGDVTLDELVQRYTDVSHLVISPGPGHPQRDSGISIPAIRHYAGKIPILGVCMGLQCMFASYGGTVDRVGEIVHGKTSVLTHDGRGIFTNCKNEIHGTRYHSLAGDIVTLPAELEVTCRTPRLGQTASDDPSKGIVMGIRHKTLTLESVQYHPESILSEEGHGMLANFLRLRGGTWEENPGFGLSSRDGESKGSAQKTKSSDSAATFTTEPSNSTKASSTNGAASAPTILTRIYAQRQQDVEKAKKTPGSYPSDLVALIESYVAPPQINFYERLLPPIGSTSTSSATPVALMAEVKRASPSKGDILPPSSPLTSATIAYSYAQAGASVISVLTEPTWFKGTLNDMLAVRTVVASLPNRPAVLRKDFVFDTYQIDEARVFGADTVLLIVAMLDDAKLKELYDYARYKRGMEPLVEVNNTEELKRALDIGAKVIGVNNRNLHDFNVDMGTTSRIAEVINEYSARQVQANGLVQDDRKVILCALSGITGRDDVVRYVKEGVGAVLVGEALMRAEDKGEFVRTLLGTSGPREQRQRRLSQAQITGPPDSFGEPEQSADGLLGSTGSEIGGREPPRVYKPLVKICGIKSVEAAQAAVEAGADFIGLVFAPKSKRYLDLNRAKEIVESVRGQQRERANRQPAQMDSESSAARAANFFDVQSRRLADSSRKPLFVGVFQNQPLETVLHTLDYLQLDIVQLHGSEPAEWCRLLGVPTFKAFHVDETFAGDENSAASPSAAATVLALNEAARPGYHSVPLLDTKLAKSNLSGGAGKTFDWSIAKQLVEEKRLPLILAGGLEVGNVSNAVRLVRPWCLDVSGGVETGGEKDLAKITEFIRAAKSAV